VPAKIRQYFKDVLGIQFLLDENERLRKRLTLLENKFYTPREELEKDARRRWQNSRPESDLTWSRQLPGNAFIRCAMGYDLFGPDRSILEIGPGYGRLLEAMEQEGAEYADYLGIDISANQIDFLTGKFGNSRREFLLGDVETITTNRRFDSVISSLTFKHLFPTFEKAMTNIAQMMNPDGKVFIDFIEGDRRLFEEDGVTFIRQYTREELQHIMNSTGFHVIAFDQVEHSPQFTRLVVIASRKPAAY